MEPFIITGIIWIAMIAHAFWESSAEGPNAWGSRMYGWKWVFTKNISITRYHFWLFVIYMPILIVVLPLVVAGFSKELFGVLAAAYFSGMVIEDFLWFIVNTEVKFKEAWNPKFANYYPWIVIGKFRIPLSYILGFGIAVLLWVFLVI